jgi:CheY-like chemotaxis protein
VYGIITQANGHIQIYSEPGAGTTFNILLPVTAEAAIVAPEHVPYLVTEVVMPQMLGKEVSEQIRAIKPDIEVLFMSGYARRVLTSQGMLDPNWP